MPPDLGQYITLADASKAFKVSTKTLRRQRDRLRVTDDPLSVATFIVRTKDGETFEKPNADLVTKLTKQGRIPEWLVNHQWLNREYGPRSKKTLDTDHPNDQVGHDDKVQTRDTPTDQPKAKDQSKTSTLSTHTELIQQIIDAKDAHIQELQGRLDNAEAEKEAMREASAQERSLYSRMLGPGNQTKVNHQANKPVDTTPRPQKVKSRPRKTAKPKVETQSATLRDRASRLFFGTKSK